jgi:twitching motility protein PilJ
MNSLKTKIRFAFGSMVVLTLLLTLLAWVGTRRTTTVITASARPVEDLQQALADMRQSEQTYLQNYLSLGFGAARAQYVSTWSEQVAVARATLPFIDSPETIAERLNEYEVAFLQSVALLEQIGNSGTGLVETLVRELSNLQTFAENERMPTTQIAILQLQELQDSLALTGSTQPLGTLNEQVAQLRSSSEVLALTSVKQTQFNDILSRYAASVGQYGLLLDALATNRKLFRDAHLGLTGLAATKQNITAVDDAPDIARRGAFWNGVILLAALGAVGLGGGLAYLLTRQVMEQIEPLTTVFDQIEAGDLTARASIVTQDDLGVVARELNQLFRETAHLVEADTERGRILASMERLADDVARIAAGDLSTEAAVTTEITGALADAFNFLREELSDVVLQVQETTLQVSASADQIQTTAEHLAIGSAQQAQQIIDTSAAIDEMSLSIEAVSSNSLRSAAIGEQALVSARAGTAAVEDTLNGMSRVDFALTQAGRRISRLQRIAREMRSVVKLIEDLTERTSILSLNASIQSTDAERYGFQRVAVEVEQLATQSAEATQHIAYLVQTIEQDAEAAANRLARTFEQVKGGLESAENAAERLREIEAVSDQLTRLIQQISLAAQQQVRGSRSIAVAMGDIAVGTRESTTGTKQATYSIAQLAQLAEQLRRSVAQFRVA